MANKEQLSIMRRIGNALAMHVQQPMKHRKMLEPVWTDLDTFDSVTL